MDLRENFILSIGEIREKFLRDSSFPVVTGYATVDGEGVANFIITRKKDQGKERYLVFEIINGKFITVFEIEDIKDYRYTGNVVLD